MYRRTDLLHPQPRGRPRKGCQWDPHRGTWVAIDPTFFPAHRQEDARERALQREQDELEVHTVSANDVDLIYVAKKR